MTTRRPHKLDLYRLAVQHPPAEVAFLRRAYTHYFPRHEPTRLREDFCGSAAVAAEWVALDEDHRALGVDTHRPTLRWADRRATRVLGSRAQDLHLIHADVLEVTAPRVDIVCALNFSAFIYHTRPSLLRYLRHARRCLDRRGLFVLDTFGGPGAIRPGVQTRRVTPPADEATPPFTYRWEQRAFDHATARIDCRIHFDLPGRPMHRVRDAFRYDWRLWTLPELRELVGEAGFDRVDVWCDGFDPARGTSDGLYRPVGSLPAREDWVAYVVAVDAGAQRG